MQGTICAKCNGKIMKIGRTGAFLRRKVKVYTCSSDKESQKKLISTFTPELSLKQNIYYMKAYFLRISMMYDT